MHNVYSKSFHLPIKPYNQHYSSYINPIPKRYLREEDFRMKYKTEICRNWELGSCEFSENCAFAHGYEELRYKNIISSNFKSKKCKQFHELGYCIYGNRCQFKHKDILLDNLENSESTGCSSRKSSDEPKRRRLRVFMDLEKKGECFI
ncbi:hypothetical protein SteCoe_11171 [Stentor coeruleus]|uniref:C3H1-type domain-containing protein n=1 Tax=Stentor coeruleus TaxID=5963 RepID=A0A1R2CDT0_9CILI|nr:hypothetical protein SteCoe_11171 [Stentor coeruleus]